jgi:hypothetical protein
VVLTGTALGVVLSGIVQAILYTDVTCSERSGVVAGEVEAVEPTVPTEPVDQRMSALLYSYKAIAARRGELLRSGDDHAEDEALRAKQRGLVRDMRREAEGPVALSAEIESILAEEP